MVGTAAASHPAANACFELGGNLLYIALLNAITNTVAVPEIGHMTVTIFALYSILYVCLNRDA